MRNRLIQRIIIHCSATKPGQCVNSEIIDKWHRDKGYKKIGYHYVILPDGTIEKGREEYEIGAHCTSYNSDSIGICYVGGLDEKGKPKDTRTPQQKIALKNLVKDLCNRYKIKDIAGHNDYSNKACPCFNVRSEFSLDSDDDNNDKDRD